MTLLLFVPLILIMYFLMIRPQQKKAKEHQALLAALEVGDDVVTEAGIYGTVSELDGATVFIMVADGVELKVTKSSIAQRVIYSEVDDVDVDDAA